MASKRKLWSDESMIAATKSVIDDGMGLRQAARLYNVPVETLRRRVTGSVEIQCNPGPHTVFTETKKTEFVSMLLIWEIWVLA